MAVMAMTREEVWLARFLGPGGPDWMPLDDPDFFARLLEAARKNGVQSLLCHDLDRSRQWSGLPPTLRERCNALLRQAAAVELMRERELLLVLDALAAAKVPVLLLKGTPLAYTLYGEPCLRERGDTDLLFEDRQMALKGWRAVEALGYQRGSGVEGELVSSQFYCTRTGDLGVRHMLDLHWRPSNVQVFAFSLGFAELATESKAIPRLGDHALTPCDRHALLLACMHRVGHAMDGSSDRLIWLHDIHLLAQGLDSAGWKGFVDLAAAKRQMSAVLDSLVRCREVLGTAIPADVLRRLEEGAAREPFSPRHAASPAHMAIMELRALATWPQRLLLLREHFFPPADYMLNKYNVANRLLLPLLYLRRAVRGLLSRLFR